MVVLSLLTRHKCVLLQFELPLAQLSRFALYSNDTLPLAQLSRFALYSNDTLPLAQLSRFALYSNDTEQDEDGS